MLRHYIVKKHIDDPLIDHLVWHHRVVYTPPLFKMMFFLLILYLLFVLLHKFVDASLLSLIFAMIGLFLYGKGIIDFLNHYLDCVVLGSRWVVVFKREGLLEYKTDTFSWERIETVSHTQDSLADKLLGKWDLVISLEHGVVYRFHNVPSPMDLANRILSTRDSYLKPLEDEDEEHDKFGLLVETLWEVIQDYMKGKKESSISDNTYWY